MSFFKVAPSMTPVYRFGHIVSRALAHVCFDYRVIHPERLIEEGPVLIVCNHSSYLDPPMVGIAYRRAIWFLARKSLFRGFGAWLYPRLNVIPVDQEGPDMSGLKNIIRLLHRGERVLLFPEGARSFDGAMRQGEPGVGLVVARTRAPVQPVRLFGTHEALPRGSALPRPSKIRLVVGEPLLFPESELGRGRDVYARLSHRMMAAIDGLRLSPAE
jgi:1-acyl-sn-glycerol-3-phosphate acyltransferase